MANLIPVSRFDDVVALEKGNPIIGARLGMSNRQAQQLLNRQTYIKDSLDTDMEDITQELLDNYDRIILRNNSLSAEIDTLNNKSDVVDVVATYADLQNYNTSTLYDKDIIKVLNDSTQNGRCSYYRWYTLDEDFTFIGVEKSSVPLNITIDTSDSPICNTSYVVHSGVELTITNTNLYAGLIIYVIAKGACTLVIDGNSVNILQNVMLQYTYNGTIWVIDKPDVLDTIYPVGSVYISLNETSPASFIGGTWQRLAEGMALMTAGSTYNGGVWFDNTNSVALTGTIGGHSLTISEIPNHVHVVNVDSGYVSADHVHKITNSPVGNGIVAVNKTDGSYTSAKSSVSYPASSYNDSHYHGVTVAYAASGSGTAHNHTFIGDSIQYSTMQEYTAVSVWTRTA